MTKSFTTKGLTFVLVFLIASGTTKAVENSVDLDTLYTIFENIAKPILESVQVQVVEEDDNNEQDSVLEQRTTRQVENLSFIPNKHMSNEIPVEEDSEETIILKIPSSSEIQPNRRKGDSKPIFTDDHYPKYKNLQDKIESLLNKEKISDKTKDLLTSAFDKIMNHINRPCISNKRSKDSTQNMKRRLLGKLDKAARKTMLKSWKHRFNKLIDHYREQDDASEINIKENSKFLTKLRDFFFEMHNDFQNLTSRYDLNCNVVNIKQIVRQNKDPVVAHDQLNSTFDKFREKNSESCTFDKICPYELKMFLIDFYTGILDKINLIFHNYTKMYLVDLSKESSSEKKTFLRVMDDVNNLVKKKYNEMIGKEKGKRILDSKSDINGKVANINKIIDKTVAKVKKMINHAFTDKAGELPGRIQSVVETDIMTNAKFELREVQEKFKAKMCKSFDTCYGKDRRKIPDK